jgi:peptidoglycan/xylan/chitin deacetylase (PgdA/CDA1 family)
MERSAGSVPMRDEPETGKNIARVISIFTVYYTIRLDAALAANRLRRRIIQCFGASMGRLADRRRGRKAPQGGGLARGSPVRLGPFARRGNRKKVQRVARLREVEDALGFRSSFNFVPERYAIDPELRRLLMDKGFEVGVHGLKHDGKLYASRKIFSERAIRINRYLREWGVRGFRSPAMHHHLEWLKELDAEYDASTFDSDPFEPQSDGVRTIFPFWVPREEGRGGYVELPYTLPQDSTLFIFMQERSSEVWKRKLDWIAEKGGMALFIAHPDYMHFGSGKAPLGEYSVEFYREFLKYVQSRYEGQYWQALPLSLARYFREAMVKPVL